MNEADWQAAESVELADAARDWLLEPGSLTAKIRAHCNEGFSLQVQREEVATESEIPANWNATHAAPRLREVTLNCGDSALVFARTLIPDPAAANDRWLLELGDRPLGDVLFQSGGERCSEFELAALDGSTELGRAALAHCDPESAKLVREGIRPIWARRSWVSLHGERLLICECFLPGLI